MTDDTNAPPPHDPESDDQFAPEPAAAEGETWQGGTPEDDFSDDAIAGETATVSEETDHSLDAGNAPENGKKRNLFLPVVAAVGGILLLGVLAYWQFGDTLHGDQQPTPMAITQSFKPKPLIEKNAPPAAPSTAETVAPKTDLAPVATQTISPSVALPTEPTTVTAPPPAAVVIAAAPVKADTSATDSRIAVLSARVEDLQKSLDQATQALSQISNKLAVSQQASVAPNPAIEDRLNGIEQKLMQMQHAAPSVEVMPDEPAQVAMPSLHSTHHKTIHRKTKTAAVHHAAAPVQVHWVLRAASPNEAWVSKDLSSEDLQPVHLGDTLPGIGRVTAIEDDSGAWVVNGTKGTIR